MKPLEKSGLLISISLVLLLNSFFVKDEIFVPPSRMFHTPDWSVRYWNLREASSPPDLLILGNSRIMYGLRAKDLENTLRARLKLEARVHSLAAPGGYFPFYRTVFEKMLPKESVPRVLLFGLSPRDFMRFNDGAQGPNERLRNSPAYASAIADSMNRAETIVRDLYATALPMLYYKSEMRERVLGKEPFPKFTLSNWKAGFFRQLRHFQKLGEFDLADYLGVLGENLQGLESPIPATETLRSKNYLADWIDGRARFYAGPPPPFELHEELGPDAQWIFDYLRDTGVRVVLFTLPAIRMEPTETHPVNYQRFLGKLELIRSRYENVEAVFDLNAQFGHAYQDPKYYFDAGEHATAEGAREFAERLGEKIAPIVASCLDSFGTKTAK
jgi:hypothetical protein